MSLKALYERFLANPSPAVLSRDVSLNYIATTTSFNGGDAVLKHLSSQQRIVKKKSDRILSAIEAHGALVVDVEITLEFVSGGGAYLPSLDDNFLADRVVTFPTVHIVSFDGQNQIQQIRLYWDQGSLLKQVDVIGSRGRNWPIRDAKDQTRLITSTATFHGTVTPPAQNSEEQTRAFSPSKKHIKDPHASLSLFANAADHARTQPAVVAPRAAASAKPPPREYNELFVGEPENEETPTKGGSPRKDGVIAPRAGAGKHYAPIRLFDDDESISAEEKLNATPVQPKAGGAKNYQAIRLFDDDESVTAQQPELRYKSHPLKYDHFELGENNDGSREIPSVVSRPMLRPMSQWDFADFATPEKPKNKIRGQDVRHFGWSDNEEELQDTPPVRPRVVQPRRDAVTHFQFEDDGAKATETGAKRVIGSAHNKGLGLYENNLYDEDGNPTPRKVTEKAPLSVVSNGAYRKKDFDSHWAIADASPPDEPTKAENRPISSDHVKAVRMMDSSWDTYDQSPETKNNAAPAVTQKRMSRNVNQRSWALGDEDDA